MNRDIANIRINYQKNTLDDGAYDANPFIQFKQWFDECLTENILEPTAAVLSTINTTTLTPYSRTVLLKEFNDKGFVFFTNYNSRKASHIADNNKACLLFFWKEMERQVMISGECKKIDAAASDAYFLSRPIDSQIGAWASPQSQEINNRAFLEDKFKAMQAHFNQQPITRPPHWGGYILLPLEMEFWQGRPNRLHDRILFFKNQHNQWIHKRLAP